MFNALMILCLIGALYNGYRWYRSPGKMLSFDHGPAQFYTILLGSIFSCYLIVMGFINVFGILAKDVASLIK